MRHTLGVTMLAVIVAGAEVGGLSVRAEESARPRAGSADGAGGAAPAGCGV